MKTSAIGILISSYLIVYLLCSVLRWIFARKHKFSEVLIGDTGLYSLSRLQAALWAFVIIGGQIAAIWACMLKVTWQHSGVFSLVFSDETLWLLGLSFGSLITVKGITISKMNESKISKDPNAQPAISDFICSNEGIDLSRFQMLIWTFIALFTYFFSTASYLDQILSISQDTLYPGGVFNELGISKFFPRFEDASKILPTVDMSFIVLMGLSNGAYIGRKLVPTFKEEQVQKEYSQYSELRVKAVEMGLTFIENEISILKNSPQIDQEQLKKLSLQQLELQQERDKWNAEKAKYKT